MKKITFILLLLVALSSTQLLATPHPANSEILKTLKNPLNGPKEIEKVKNQILSLAGKAVPSLITVMKSADYPDKNRWVATFLLGQIMGEKASPFLKKFLAHPSWVMRMASLKTLLALKEKDYAKDYGDLLKDQSLLVRTQALENIRRLELGNLAPNVWAMLYDKGNYYVPSKKGVEGPLKRTHIIKDVITTIGDLKFEKAKGPLLTMIQKEKYQDIFEEMDYALGKITGKKSPESSTELKKRFWKQIAVSEVTI